jgi:hypothetical protein
MQFFFNENMLGKILGFGCMHENKIFFFCFFKKEINLKYFDFFFEFSKQIYEMFRRKPSILIPNLYHTV